MAATRLHPVARRRAGVFTMARRRAGVFTVAGVLTAVGTLTLTLALVGAAAAVSPASPSTPPIPTVGLAFLTIAAEPNPAALPPHRPGAGGGEVDVSVTLSGSTTQTTFLDLYLEPGTMACAASTLAEEARGSAARPTAVNGSTVQGPFSQQVGENFNAPGAHRLCGYLTPDTDPSGNESASPSATGTLLLTVEPAPLKPPAPAERQCVVPPVVGLRLAAAKRALVAAGCRLGTVRRVAAAAPERGDVISQTPVAGRHLPAGTAVNVVVGARRTKQAGPPPH